MKREFEGKCVVVTGATSGIGLEASRAFARRGAYVIGVGRNEDRCRGAEAMIRATARRAQVQYFTADLSLMENVRSLADSIRRLKDQSGDPGLDVLVNNAGIYSNRYVKTSEGIELTLAVNHLAPFLLTEELLPQLQAASGKVITISSQSHYHANLSLERLNDPPVYFGLGAYQRTKLANVLFTLELRRRFNGSPMRAYAVDPGLVNTRIGLKGTDLLSRLFWELRRRSGVDPQVPVRTILYLAGDRAIEEREAIYWYDCRPKTPSPQALSEDLAGALWRFSERLCKQAARVSTNPDKLI